MIAPDTLPILFAEVAVISVAIGVVVLALVVCVPPLVETVWDALAAEESHARRARVTPVDPVTARAVLIVVARGKQTHTRSGATV